MARILTGVQSTDVPHLGNIMGAMLPAIQMANASKDESFLFIADLHSLTSIKDGVRLRNNTYAVAAAWLALGLDTEKSVFYRQSKVPECCELTWYLNCFMPYGRLQLAHSFKDKSDRMDDVNSGLFTYPVLMAADILLYDADVVPVGKDQEQHLEFARDLARRVNHRYAVSEDQPILIEPTVQFKENAMSIPGVDGLHSKMSKSKGNVIMPLGTTNKELKQQIFGIVTDSTPLEDSKNPTNVITALLDLFNEERANSVRESLQAGGYGWGHAKKELLEEMGNFFQEARERYDHLLNHRDEIDSALAVGEEKARVVATKTLERVRAVMGY